ncbi:hypothetical protein JCGZ_26913 [Jatropha curcas]|uniref:Uncharacterized protein n=1 Tax=Jatropha curcas TaxID=180498 RepID=A0A067LBM7_JATCU|nr:hypothetical protein JCGZ_26913 [Jatropha curcas]
MEMGLLHQGLRENIKQCLFVSFWELGPLSRGTLDLATSGKGGMGPYIGICAIVAFIGISTALVQVGAVGDLSLMCPEFVQSYLAGFAAAGALTSVLKLITKAAFARLIMGFERVLVMKYYHAKAAAEGSTTVSADLAAAGIQTSAIQHGENGPRQLERLSKKELFFQNIDYAVDLVLIHVLTLAIFPGFLYENTGEHKLGEWKIYSPNRILEIGVQKGHNDCKSFEFSTYSSVLWLSVLGLTYGYLTMCVLTAAPTGYRVSS